ncbi:MAG: hypothetical protein FJY07_13480 [Bacteroidetes bacterium]|nr:hypothetical protein [Bacteroidota bacterium]
MDAKLTLSFDENVVRQAKDFAARNNISLSRLVEYLLAKTTAKNYASLEDLPIAEWVLKVSEGEIEYKTKKRSRKDLRDEYLASRR